MKENETIVLASASPRRQELLRQIGCGFRVVVSDAEELSGELLATRLVQASETPLDDALRGQLKNRAHRALERFLKSVQDEGARK